MHRTILYYPNWQRLLSLSEWGTESAGVYTLILSREARAHVKVVIDGLRAQHRLCALGRYFLSLQCRYVRCAFWEDSPADKRSCELVRRDDMWQTMQRKFWLIMGTHPLPASDEAPDSYLWQWKILSSKKVRVLSFSGGVMPCRHLRPSPGIRPSKVYGHLQHPVI